MITDERVQDALEQLVRDGEKGVQVAAYLGEELIVDAWIGTGDGDAPVGPDTLFPTLSSSKGHISFLTHLWAERGLLDIDDPIAEYWPEYAEHGKDKITIRHVLRHRAGVPQMPQDLTPETLDDWDGIVSRLAGYEPLSAPEELSHYHGVTIYYLLGEVLRRTDPQGRLYDQLFLDEVCAPLGLTDTMFRLPASERARAAMPARGGAPAAMSAGGEEPKPTGGVRDGLAQASAGARAAGPPPGYRIMQANVFFLQDPEAYASMLTGNLWTTARDGAKFWAILANGGEVDGVKFLSRERVDSLPFPRPNPDQLDEITLGAMPFGVAGFQLPFRSPYMAAVAGSGKRILAHHGGGGTIGWADLDTKLAVMYTHNRFGTATPFAALGDAVRAVAAERSGERTG